MKSIHCVMVTHNRLHLTLKTLETLCATVPKNVSLYLSIWDNASEDETRKYLNALFSNAVKNKKKEIAPRVKLHEIVLSNENKYPGFAYNHMWEQILIDFPKTDYLMATDNDILFLDGWYEEAEKIFNTFEEIGQVGLLNNMQFIEPEHRQKSMIVLEKNGVQINCQFPNVAGSFLLKPDVFRKGARWNEGTWDQTTWPAYHFSKAVVSKGYGFCNVIPNVAYENVLDDYELNPTYYEKTFAQRGVLTLLKQRRKRHKEGGTKDGYVT